jgi:hypothetical protein
MSTKGSYATITTDRYDKEQRPFVCRVQVGAGAYRSREDEKLASGGSRDELKKWLADSGYEAVVGKSNLYVTFKKEA